MLDGIKRIEVKPLLRSDDRLAQRSVDMGVQQTVADSIYYLLGGEHVCPNITDHCVYCIGAVFCVMLTVIYVVNKRAGRQLRVIKVRISCCLV